MVILVLHGAVSLRNRAWIALAPFALAAVALTNWPGSMGLSLAVLAYCLSQIGAFRISNWLVLIGTGVAAYLIASPWLPPSVIVAVIRNAQQSAGTSFGSTQFWPGIILVAASAALLMVFKWAGRESLVSFLRFLHAAHGRRLDGPGMVRMAIVAAGQPVPG